MITARYRAVVACTLALALWPRFAEAQAAKSIELSAGYAWMNDTTDGEALPAGWEVGTAVGLTQWLSVAGEAGGQYASVAVLGDDIRLRTYALMGGLRASAHVGPFVEFGQMLAGLSHASGTAFGSTESVVHAAWQPGAGIDLPVGRHVRARAEIDERLVSGIRELRIVGAAVFTWRLP